MLRVLISHYISLVSSTLAVVCEQHSTVAANVVMVFARSAKTGNPREKTGTDQTHKHTQKLSKYTGLGMNMRIVLKRSFEFLMLPRADRSLSSTGFKNELSLFSCLNKRENPRFSSIANSASLTHQFCLLVIQNFLDLILLVQKSGKK